MRTVRRVLTFGSLLCTGTIGNAAEISVVGTWQVKSFTYQNLATKELSYPFGHDVTGYIQYSPGGHMVVFLQQANPTVPAKLPYSDADRAAAHRTIFGAYAGTYSVEGTKVVHDVIASYRPDNIGRKLTRYIQMDGKQLTLTTAPQISSVSAAEEGATL